MFNYDGFISICGGAAARRTDFSIELFFKNFGRALDMDKEALCDIRQALSDGRMRPKACGKIRGRPQFACGQLTGCQYKRSSKARAAHGLQQLWALDERTRGALQGLEVLMSETGPKRCVAASESLCTCSLMRLSLRMVTMASGVFFPIQMEDF